MDSLRRDSRLIRLEVIHRFIRYEPRNVWERDCRNGRTS